MSDSVTVSVLFTDLVGSTELGSRLGPDRTEQLRITHFGLLRSAIEETGGTEVKNLGDGLMVAFATPSRALTCAIRIQQGIDHHNQRAPDRLGIRIGLSVGEAVQDDGDYFGDTVVEAARLCAAADGGQILTTELFRAMVGRHAGQSFVPVGLIELKGMPEPVAAVEVRWEPLAAQALVPLPGPMIPTRATSPFGFVGRAGELGVLGEVRKAAFTEPKLQTVLVAGEAGIGKTTLIAHAAGLAHAEGVTIVLGHCDEDLTVPYEPWIAALSHLVDHLGADCIGGLPPLHRTAIARLVPSLGSEPWTLGDAGDSERLVLMHAIQLLLSELSADTPILVVLDDIHWADSASLQVLRHLVESAAAMAVLLVCTYRNTDLGPDSPLTLLLADLHRQPGVTRLQLDGMDDVETVEMVTKAAGHDLDADGVLLGHTLRRETAGNPFFTVELLRHLRDSGAITMSEDGRWAMQADLEDAVLPASVRDVVARRVSRLGADAVRVLSAAAVIGRDFKFETLARVAELPEDEVLELLETATVAAVVSEVDEVPGAYRFNHALIQHTLYRGLGAARRARTHQRVAEAIESDTRDSPSRTAELAHHWMAAVRPTEVDKALHYVTRAADDALASLAPHDAIAWYRQALDLATRGVDQQAEPRCRLLIGLGTAQRQVGAVEHRATVLEAIGIARQIENTELLVAALLAADRGFSGTSGSDDEWVDATRAGLDAIEPGDSNSRARLLTILSQSIDAREWERRRELSEEAVDVARRLGDDATLLAILPVAYQHHRPDALDLRLAETAEALDLADRLGDQVAACNALFHRVDACIQNADIAEVDRRIAELADRAELLALPVPLWQLHMTISWRALLDGRCTDSETSAEAALAIGTAIGFDEAVLAYGGQLIEIRRHQGRLAEMIGFLEEVETENASAIGFRQALMSVYCDLGRLDEARPLLAQDVAENFRDVPDDEAWLAIIVCCASAAVTLGDRQACRILYDRILPYEGRIAAAYAMVTGSVARHLGCLASVLECDTEAREHFQVALEVHQRIGAPYWTACTQLDLHDMLVRRAAPGDEATAQDLRANANAIARSHGYLALETRSSS